MRNGFHASCSIHLQKFISKSWENFVFATLVFAHFAFATLNFDILFLPYSLPLWGKMKTKTKTKGAKAKQKLIIFILVLPHIGQK
jgi:hypothetical protein